MRSTTASAIRASTRLDYEQHYTERTLRLADSFWCYDPLTEVPEVNALPAAERGYLTLGCLNNPCKFTEHTLQLWGRVMQALPDARLKLHGAAGSASPSAARAARRTRSRRRGRA